ncbi:uncharacterized protein LOC132560585 [Ylistrum balloti]|uniref:uncharacterized protein LOC132560585 n=1 Tax=Ylistrum balloti TaxID=509963 RepID=UPI0029058FD6|nr:uncharacterized protein LOC132560585 [Ylistrum balloti]
MAGTSVCLLILCLIWETSAFEARITKPVICDRDEVRFHRGHKYLYHYSTTVETSFVGTTKSKSAFKLDCEVVVEARRKCEAYMNVTTCSLYHRQLGEDDLYIKDTALSADITNLLGGELYFQFGSGTIRPHTIVVDQAETNDALNIKRGILSALQIKLITEAPGDQTHTMETEDLIGSCPTEYIVETPNRIHTSRDITKCQVPHYNYRQNNLISMIKSVYGGYVHGVIDELIYPFNSTIKCEHTLGINHRLEETICLQQQQFRPFAREGAGIATCMTNVSQHLILQETGILVESNVNRKMKGKKSGSLMYEFDDRGETILVTRDDISHWLHSLATHNDTLETNPKLFHGFLWCLRQAQINDMLEVMADVWNCHGNHGNQCNKKEQRLKQDFFLDGLLSCGTEECINVFTQAMRAGRVNSWLEYMFVYDVALYHKASTQVATSMLEMCQEREGISCWFPLSIMVGKLATSGGLAVDMESGPLYRTLHHVRQTIGDTCQNGISQTLTETEKQHTIDELLVMIKVLGNIGEPVQYIYDNKYTGMEGGPGDRRLVQALLQCAYNTDLPHKVSKTAVLALHNMAFTSEMKDALVGILGDMNRPPSLRTMVFARLIMQPDRELAAGLYELVYTEKMRYMKNYIITYIKSLLKNDQPDLQHLRNIWQDLIDADSRRFPYGSHFLGKSKYIEMSRYVRFPISVEYYGLQIEIDTVYNIASPVVNAVVLRVNYYAGEKVNLLELAADIDDFHVILDAISQDINILQKLFPLPSRQFDTSRDEMVFSTLQKNIVAAILELFDKINLSQMNVPDGLIHVKVLGQELFYLEVRDLMKVLLQKSSRHSIQEVVMRHLHTILGQLPMYRTSSTSLVDIVKVLPTIGGFPLNMTVSVAMNMGLEFDAKLSMPDILSLKTDIKLDSSIKTHAAVHFNGELMTKFGRHTLSGAAASSSGLLQLSIAPSLRFNPEPNPPRVFDMSLSQTNTDSKYTIASMSGKLYLMTPSGEIEEIEPDPEIQTTIHDCDRGLLSAVMGNQVCFTTVFPNTTSSTSHPYFPLSGPFHFSLDTRKVETNSFQLSIVRDWDIDDHLWINITRQGQENMDGLILHANRKDRLHLVELLIPDAQIHLYFKRDRLWSYGVITTGYRIFDVHLSVSGKSLNRFLVEERWNKTLNQDRTSTLTTRVIVDVVLAIPGASLAVTVNSFRNRQTGHYNTAFNVTYHCIKARPLMYLLHWNPSLARQNGDTSVAQFVNDAVIGYINNTSNWRANDFMLLKLPGFQFSLENKMEANVTHANRHTVIVYTGITGQEHTVTMDAHVTNSSIGTYNNYDYFMLLTHTGMPYNLSLRGHLKGSSRNLNILTEIEHISKTIQESSSLGETNLSDTEDGLTGEGEGGSEVSPDTVPCIENPGKTVVTLTVVGVPVPDGIEMRWDYNYTRDVCGGQVLYRSIGLYGRQRVNTRKDFHHWVTVNATVTKSRDAVGQQDVVVKSKSYSSNFRFRFKLNRVLHVVLDYSSQLINASYILHLYDISGRNISALNTYKFHTPWPVINFDIRHFYRWTDHLIHETEVSTAWIDIDTTAHYYIGWFFPFRIEVDSTIDSRMPWLPGKTNVTGKYEMAQNVLPQLLVTLERTEGTIEVKADMVNTRFNIIIVTFYKPDDTAMHVLTWEMSLTSPHASTHTLSWNPDLVRVVSDDVNSRLSGLRLGLVAAGEVALLNAEKPVYLMVIPLTDMTVGVFFETYLYPYLRFHLTNGEMISTSKRANPPDDTEINGVDDSGPTQQRKPTIGDLGLGILSRTVGTVLKSASEVSTRPPWLVERLMNLLLRPSIDKILAESRVTFTAPLIGEWRSFVFSPRSTYGQRYLEQLYSRLSSGPYSSDKSVSARVVNRQYLVTFYGRIYHIPDDQAADCVHLLAADYERKTFAILLSRQGITVVTSEMSVTLEFGGNVFRDNCPRPVRLPLGREGSRMHVYIQRNDLILTTTYGVRVSCPQRRDVCHIHLTGKHFGNSWGLLGSNDGEPGSDFQFPNKYIASSVTNTFIQSYAVGGPPKCISSEYYNHAVISEPLHFQSPNNVQTPCSREMEEECNRQFNLATTNYDCDSFISPQQFLDSCLSEARSCGRVASDACKHIRAYEFACRLKISHDIIFVNCTLDTPSSSDEGSRRPVDIVVVVSDNLESSRSDIETHVEILLHQIKHLSNVQLGIIGYGGDVEIIDALDPSLSTRYMVALDTLDVGVDNSPWRTAWKRFPNVDTMNDALDMAASYPYRLNTQRVVIVISREMVPSISDEVKLKYQNLDIIVNSFGDYKSLDPSKKVHGINWDNTVINWDWMSSYQILPLPEGSLVELVVATKGAVFNADIITERRKTRLKKVVKHIKEQIKFNDVC